METIAKTKITVGTVVSRSIEKVWELWTEPKHIMHWNYASTDWHTPYAENDFRVGGKFLSRMESIDGKEGFDFAGEYTSIELYHHIEYNMTDGRRVRVSFETKGTGTRVTVIFESEVVNSVERQQEGWQAILDNFKRYAESYTDEILHFEITIDCDPEKVYHTLTGSDSFRKWTSVFNPDSYFEGSWDKHSQIKFIGTDSNGQKEGMISRIRENLPNKFISIEHLGIIRKGIEITCGPDVDDWQGAMENYTLIPRGNQTLLSVDVDPIRQLGDELNEAWPEALKKLKSLCEKPM